MHSYGGEDVGFHVLLVRVSPERNIGGGTIFVVTYDRFIY